MAMLQQQTRLLRSAATRLLQIHRGTTHIPHTQSPPNIHYLSTTTPPQKKSFIEYLRDTFHTTRTRNMHKREERQFRAMLSIVLGRAGEFDCDDYREYLTMQRRQDGMMGVSMYMPWNRGNGVLETFSMQEKVLNVMSGEERKGIMEMGVKGMSKVARKAGVEVGDVEFVKERIGELVNMQAWLRNVRLGKGKRLPYTEEEMKGMMMTPGMTMKEKDKYKKGNYIMRHRGRSPQTM